MTDTAGEFRIVVLFAVFEAERLKSRWFGVDVVGRAIEHFPKTGRHPIPVQHRPHAHSILGAALCCRPFHRDSAAGGRLGGGEGRDRTILDLVNQSTQRLRFVLCEPRGLPQRALQVPVPDAL